MSFEIDLLGRAQNLLLDELDRLVGACLDAHGKPKPPQMHDLLRARAFLPSRCRHAIPSEPK